MNKIIHNDRTHHVILSLRYEGRVCMVAITIPNVPVDHHVSVGEAILNLDMLFGEMKSLDCITNEGEPISIPLEDGIPKSSQIMMLAYNVIVMNDAEYRQQMKDVWEEEKAAAKQTHEASNTVN